MKIHFTGIGGVGMAGLAVLMKERGHEVTGCDVHASSRTRWLEEKGIPVFVGHDPAHVADVDQVVITPAVRPSEPERLAAEIRTGRVSHIRFRGEVLADLVNSTDSIAVCGTHGKTTTSTWIARLLIALGEDVTWCIGGETGDFPVAGHRTVREGVGGTVLVVEADESDGTLALYRARTLVVNKLEYDHPDHFKTEADYFACFDTARRQAGDVVDSEALPPADPIFAPLLDPLPAHNRKNARAAIEVALRRGHSPAAIAAALPEILAALPDRRFQRVWPVASNLQPSTSNLQIYTDYAHHPTEMACAVGMARQICKGTLRVLFQPHRPSRTKALLADFPKALAEADELILCPTYMAFEPPVEGGDIADLYKACRENGKWRMENGKWRMENGKWRMGDGKRVRGEDGGCGEGVGGGRIMLAQSCEEAWEHARNSMKPGDLTLLLGAGDIIRLVPKIQSELHAVPGVSSRPAPSRKLWIGAGTNTWKSDLNLSVEYVKTQGPAGRLGAELVAAHPELCPWMAGIPGTVGGWIKMNAGAFGHAFSEALEAVKVDGTWIPAADCGFAYRHSDIKGEIQDYRLREAKARGEVGWADSLSPSAFASRRKRFPAGTYGSFFKNPPNGFAGRLLEEAGAKALRVGGAYVWAEHANVIVRGPDATNSDVLALARLMRNRVCFRFGITLEPEVVGLAL